MYGKLRQTDFLPVGEDLKSEIRDRGVLSETSATEDEGREYVGMGADPNFSVDDLDPPLVPTTPTFKIEGCLKTCNQYYIM